MSPTTWTFPLGASRFGAIGTLAAVWVLVAAAGIECARAGFRENYESPETSWNFAGADTNHRLLDHRRVQTQSHWGHGCEQLRYTTSTGSFLYLSQSIDRPRVIEELSVSIWVKSPRPGVQLLARVVFPRCIDPKTSRPVTALLQGSIYRDAGAWQRLTLEGTPQLVAQQARVLRLQIDKDVDVREAYLDLVVLNAYCGVGTNEIFIDDLEIEGYLPVKQSGWQPADQGSDRPSSVQQAQFASAGAWQSGRDGNAPPVTQVAIEQRGAVLMVDGHPVFVRAIEHRGESFEFLKRLGFNAVQIGTPPSPWQIAEARRHNMWIIAPPPAVGQGRSVGPNHDRVIAWHLGADLDGRQLAGVRDLAFALRRADKQPGRPLIAQANEALRAYSRVANVMLLRREPLGSSHQLNQYSDWFTARRQLLRPGTPAWAIVQTQPPAGQLEQAKVAGVDANPNVEPQQLRLLAWSALTAGARGLVFTSRDRLDGDGSPEVQRAQLLEMVNRELDLIEPWLALGSHVTPLDVSQPGVRAAMFSSQQSQLILLTQIAEGSQHCIAPPAVNRLSLVVPGVSESSDAYQISPTGVRPLAHRRVTGGVGVALKSLGWATALVFTTDPLIYARVAQNAATERNRVTELQLASTVSLLERTKSVLAQRSGNEAPRDLATRLSLIDVNLQQADRMVNDGVVGAASMYTQRASVALAQVRRAAWEDSIMQVNGIQPPVARCFEIQAIQPWATITAGASRATEQSGNMESLDRMTQAGWRHYRHEQPQVRSFVELSTVAPRTGEYSLRMEATRGGDANAALVETPPVWIRSPNAPIRAGQTFRVSGFVRIDSPLVDSFDGLMIYESVTGKEGAITIGRTDGWERFTLFGTAVRDQHLTVDFELTGLGEAMIDDVEIVVGGVTRTSPESRAESASRLRDLIRLPRR